MVEDFSDTKKVHSQYNEANYQIDRVNFYWMKANDRRDNRDLIGWNTALDIIWSDLVGSVCKVKDYSFDEWISSKEFDLMKKFNAQIRSVLRLNKRLLGFELLSRKHEFIKIVQEDIGKGGRYVDPDEEAFSG